MSSNDIVLRVINALERCGIAYMLVGSYSSNAFGISRSTQDADFVIELGQSSIAPLIQALNDILDFDPQMRMETVTATFRYVARSRTTPFKIELFMLSDDIHDRERFARRERTVLLTQTAFLPTAEDVVIQKLRWFGRARRAKDLDDSRNVLAVQAGKLDYAYIRQWCAQHNTLELFEKLYEEARQFET